MRRVLYILGLLTCLQLVGSAQEIAYKNYVYVTNIRSVKFHPQGQPLEMPVVGLNDGKLSLSFDDLTEEYRDYSYKLIHCSRDWKPSELSDIEYISGFQNEEIRSYTPSQSTFVPYINFSLTLPNKDITWTKSGNYLLVVYEGEDVDDRIPVITRRFVVVEDKVGVVANAKRPVAIQQYNTHQILDLYINKKKMRIANAQRDITVSLLQNGRWDMAYENIMPLYESGEKVVIDNRGKIAFAGNREFRPLDIRSLDYASAGINEIALNRKSTDVIKFLEKPRKHKNYVFLNDANGHFVIQTKDGGSDHSAGDYAKVHFKLKYPEGHDVYVAGEFSDFEMDDMYKMTYDSEQRIYTATILLKQGFYDYTYGVKDGETINYSIVEGDSFETQNTYNIIVYYREPGVRYDRAIGYTVYNYKISI